MRFFFAICLNYCRQGPNQVQLGRHGIKSLYHEYWKEQQGSETRPTLLFTYNEEKPFHIDYSFGSDWFVQRMTSMTVGKAGDWLKLSDQNITGLQRFGMGLNLEGFTFPFDASRLAGQLKEELL